MNVSERMLGQVIPVILNLLVFISFAGMVIYGFFLLVKFLRAGTKAFDIYIQSNEKPSIRRIDNPEK